LSRNSDLQKCTCSVSTKADEMLVLAAWERYRAGENFPNYPQQLPVKQ
ncbi:hypothetical protein PC116_g29853, partial [Phytophthora cactorum]